MCTLQELVEVRGEEMVAEVRICLVKCNNTWLTMSRLLFYYPSLGRGNLFYQGQADGLVARQSSNITHFLSGDVKLLFCMLGSCTGEGVCVCVCLRGFERVFVPP